MSTKSHTCYEIVDYGWRCQADGRRFPYYSVGGEAPRDCHNLGTGKPWLGHESCYAVAIIKDDRP